MIPSSLTQKTCADLTERHCITNFKEGVLLSDLKVKKCPKHPIIVRLRQDKGKLFGCGGQRGDNGVDPCDDGDVVHEVWADPVLVQQKKLNPAYTPDIAAMYCQSALCPSGIRCVGNQPHSSSDPSERDKCRGDAQRRCCEDQNSTTGFCDTSHEPFSAAENTDHDNVFRNHRKIFPNSYINMTTSTSPPSTPVDEKVLKWLISTLKLSNCDIDKMSSCGNTSREACLALLKPCLYQVAKIDCDQVDNLADQIPSLLKSGDSSGFDLNDFAKYWNGVFDASTGKNSATDWQERDLGVFIGRLGGNLKCFANAANSKWPNLTTKLVLPSDALDKGIREGQKTVTKHSAAMIIGLGVLLMILLGVGVHLVFKHKPQIAGLVNLAVVVLVTVLMIVCVTRTNM